jgi:hypothetical protein
VPYGALALHVFHAVRMDTIPGISIDGVVRIVANNAQCSWAYMVLLDMV